MAFNRRQKMVQQAFLDNEEAVIKRLKTVYNKSLEDITDKAARLQKEFEELESVYDTVEDEEERKVLKSRMRSKVYQKQYQDSLKKQVSGIIDKLHDEDFKTVSEYLEKCYDDGFLGTMYDLQGQGIPMCFPLNQEAMVRAVQLDSKISEGLYNHLGENYSLLKKRITAEVSRGIASSMTYGQVAQQLAAKMTGIYKNPGGALAYSMRIARTEGHRIQCQATMDACYSAKDRGADIVKQWDATLDARTRDSHAKVDGEFKELDEKFSNGLMFPGDPNGMAAEVIHCRCALLQRARWAVGSGFTKMNNFTKQLETFESPEDYAEFKKAFFSKENKAYMNNVQKMEEKYGTKDFVNVLDKMDTREYNRYSKLVEQNPVFNKGAKVADAVATPKKAVFTPAKTLEEAEEAIGKYVDTSSFGALGVSYSGISIETANKVNETITNLYEQFDLDPLGGVYVAKGNTKLGQMVDGATAAYSPIRKSLILNNRAMKNVDDIVEAHAKEIELVKAYSKDPTSLTFRTKRAEAVTKASVLSGRATVPDTIEDVIHHEMGHSIERKIMKSESYETIKKNMSKYAEKISGYATTSESEYIAESFASYLKGEEKIDPTLKKAFDSMRKGQNAGKTIEKITKSGIISPESNQLAKFSSKDFKTIRLPKQEYAHVMSELSTHMSDEQRRQAIVKKAIGDYVYTVENNGFGDYRIIGKKAIDGIGITDDEWGD